MHTPSVLGIYTAASIAGASMEAADLVTTFAMLTVVRERAASLGPDAILLSLRAGHMCRHPRRQHWMVGYGKPA
jgi:hypothetical protein